MATIRNAKKEPDLKFGWGEIRWLCNGEIDPASEMTFGVVEIGAGQSNPRHHHPNCEEIIFVMEGRCDHSLGDEVVPLEKGDALRIPRGVTHHAVNTGDGPVRMVIAYSTPHRQTVGEETDAFKEERSGSSG